MKLSEETTQKIENNELGANVTGSAQAADFGSLFSLHLSTAGTNALQSIGQWIMFPFAALSSSVLAVLAWRDVYLKKGKINPLIRALVETGTALTLIPVVIGLLAASAIFTPIAPFIFAAITAVKMSVDAGTALYYSYKLSSAVTEDKKKKYRGIVIDNMVSAVAGFLMTIGIVGLMILAIKPLAVAGIVAGAIGLAKAAYNVISHFKKKKKVEAVAPTVKGDDLDHSLSSTAVTLSATNKAAPARQRSASEASREERVRLLPSNHHQSSGSLGLFGESTNVLAAPGVAINESNLRQSR